MQDIDLNFKSGFVSIIGKPNVGKSTLMNKLIGEKLSIISPKPQTTRHSIKGFFSDEKRQIIFLDTPGFLKPRYELHQRMLNYVMEALKDADLILYITDVINYPTDYDNEVCDLLKPLKKPKVALLNKIDLAKPGMIEEKTQMLAEHFDKIFTISALNDTDFTELIEYITQFIPLNPPFFNPEDLSDMPMRFFVQEIIREQIFLNYDEEIPYSTAVTVELYKDLPNKSEIWANIWIERDSQKPIILGKNGEKIKEIRINAEKEIHKLTQKRVTLKLWLKIKPGWRKKVNALKEFGYR